jgi:hypothetical protein
MFLDLAYHIVFLHIVPDFTKWRVLEFIFVFSYTYVYGMDRNYCVIGFIVYKSCSDT